ncbi:MAG: response regulator, partial [Desulfobulbaceae bacterium]|nr:response regulator [Desulfobulbaceae bacterium]
LESVDFHLEDVVANVLNTVSQPAQEKGLLLDFSLAPDVPLDLTGDPLRLGQILVNLMGNGVKFTAQGGVGIEVHRVAQRGEGVALRFVVRDSGIGMTEEQVGGLFRAFSQADASTTRMYGGTGLGLAICKQLVALMDGTLEVESEPGRGSAFSVTVRFLLPGENARRKHHLPAELGGMRVLVVDDNRAVRLVMEKNLQAFSCEVTTVGSGEEALAAAEEAACAGRPYGLVLMDWVMPGMDGIEAGRRIKEDAVGAHSPKVILITAYDRDEVVSKAEENGLDGFLIKPVTRSALFNAIMVAFAGQDKGRDFASGRPQEAMDRELTPLCGARILVVEDNEINQQVAREMLEGVGMVVELAANGLEALEAVREHCYDLVFMDIQMPEMDGNEACRRIRADFGERGERLPVIAMTAHAMAEERERSFGAGMSDYLTKPVDPEALYQLLLRWLKPKADAGKVVAAAGSWRDRAAAVAAPSAPLPELAGIDVKKGLARMGGSVANYRGILARFREIHGKIAEELRNALAGREGKVAERLAHSLKGSAGTIGAQALQGAAAALEQALAKGDAEGGERGLQQVEKELTSVLAAIVSLAVDRENGPERDVQPQPEELASSLEALAALLRAQDTAARRAFSEVRRMLVGLIRTGELNRLEKKIGNYDFDGALVQLVDLAKGMNIRLQEE